MTVKSDEELEHLEDLLGHRFHDKNVLRMALRHGSATTAQHRGSYQRLEFLGDAVIGHAVAQMLFSSFPG